MAYHRRMSKVRGQPEISPESIRAAVLRVLPDIDVIYLFGSRARGDAHADSDLDLAVLSTLPLEPLRRFEAQRELSALLDCDVDLVDLQKATSVLRSEVVNSGTRLFQCDAERALDFEARVLGEYAALLEATRAIRDDIRQRGRVHA